MTSKFSFKSFFPLLCILPLIFGLTFYIAFLFDTTQKMPPFHGIPLVVLLTFTIAWLFFGEFRTKMIKVELAEDYLSIKKFGGLSAGKKFLYCDLDGYKISILRSAGADTEYLYLMQRGAKVGKISDFYHKNYAEMKQLIKTKIKDLGVEKFSFKEEIKESLS